MRLSIALIALGLVAAPAAAQEVTLRVAYDDAELTTDAGLAALDARLIDAAKEACLAPTDGVISLSEVNACKGVLVRKARSQVQALVAETAE